MQTNTRPEHRTCIFVNFLHVLVVSFCHHQVGKNGYINGKRDRGGTVVKVLCYKSEGRWFDPRWCHWNFSLT